MTTAQRDAIASPTAGQTIFNTDTQRINVYNGAVWTALPGGALNPDQVANLFAWYKAESIALTDGANVTGWADQSGNGYNLVNNAAAAANPPVYAIKGINGKPAVAFDGVNHRRSFLSSNVTLPQPFTVIVAATAHTTDNMVMWCNTQNATPVQHYMTSLMAYAYADSGISTVAAVAAVDIPFVMTVVFNGASSIIRFNGSQVMSGDVGSRGLSAEQMTIGAGPNVAGNFFWYGNIGEVVIYGAAPSDSQLASVENYLLAKFGIPAQAHE